VQISRRPRDERGSLEMTTKGKDQRQGRFSARMTACGVERICGGDAVEGVRVFAHEKDECGGLRIRLRDGVSSRPRLPSIR